MKCRTYEQTLPGDIYHAYKSGGGPECGKEWNGSYYVYYYCKGGDYCSSSSSKQCKVTGMACAAIYTSYKSAGGPECGKDWNGSYYVYYYCKGGDYCSSSSSKQCKIATTCPPGTLYHAYKSAGGPECGKDWNGSYYVYYYCKPLDTCQSSASKLCKM